MVKIHTNHLWNGWKAMANPLGVIIHNDYGRMSALAYEGWLKGRVSNPGLGFAHDYIDRNTIAHYVPDNRAAYHAGDGPGTGNSRYIGIEVAQSRGPEFGDITQAQFLENEDMALRQAAEYHHKYGWSPNRETVKLHNQFSSTSCPHLSQSIHGHGTKVQDYFIAKIKAYMKLGKTVEEITNAESGGKEVVVKEERPATPTKTIAQVAQEVIDGKWGNNPKRKSDLIAAGYNYSEVQGRVNDILTGGSKSEPETKKSVTEVAQEVINGQWDNGEKRKQNLQKAGYNFNAVQNKVNELLGAKAKPKAKVKSVNQLAQEVIDGKHGNGDARKKSLGNQYNVVQKRVNEILNGKGVAAAPKKKSIDTIAKEVIDGKWGNDPDRSRKLKNAGYNASAVQRRVNQLLR